MADPNYVERAAARNESWFTTSRGRQFFPWRPEPAKITLEDIAHTLSQINRWGGHTKAPYSVAQHSVLVSQMVPPEKALWGLLHDATEAYMGGDIVSPIKRHVPDLVALEQGIADAITVKFNLPPGALEDPEVKDADLLVLAWEYRDLMPRTVFDADGSARIPMPMAAYMTEVPLDLLVPWTAGAAAVCFLGRAAVLGLKTA